MQCGLDVGRYSNGGGGNCEAAGRGVVCVLDVSYVLSAFRVLGRPSVWEETWGLIGRVCGSQGPSTFKKLQSPPSLGTVCTRKHMSRPLSPAFLKTDVGTVLWDLAQRNTHVCLALSGLLLSNTSPLFNQLSHHLQGVLSHGLVNVR